jgi:hypothetical protein
MAMAVMAVTVAAGVRTGRVETGVTVETPAPTMGTAVTAATVVLG